MPRKKIKAKVTTRKRKKITPTEELEALEKKDPVAKTVADDRREEELREPRELTTLQRLHLEQRLRRGIKKHGGYRKGLKSDDKANCDKWLKLAGRTPADPWNTDLIDEDHGTTPLCEELLEAEGGANQLPHCMKRAKEE